MSKARFWISIGLALAVGCMLGQKVEVPSSQAQDAGEVSPVKPRARDFYVPNSEALGADEMRIVACGTGMPTARPSQAASCWLVELGNGDKFIFDLGTGSAERISAMQIPYNYLDKVFLSHLHTDHFGDIMAMFVGGALAGRQKPLRVWGPSGDTPERGTKYAIEHVRKALTWDLAGRKGLTDPRGYHLEATEFDYKAVNQVVYQENGVTIRSWPAIHALDGSVSFSLEWNGLKFVFGGDTYPNKWYDEFAKDADLAIHECFVTVPADDREVQVHAAERAGGRHADPHRAGGVRQGDEPDQAADGRGLPLLQGLRHDRGHPRARPTTYDGPLSLAEDYMVWNVTKDDIRVRMAIIDEDVWPPPATEKPQLPDASTRIPYSEFVVGGKLDMQRGHPAHLRRDQQSWARDRA